jgi:hypothetical protein
MKQRNCPCRLQAAPTLKSTDRTENDNPLHHQTLTARALMTNIYCSDLYPTSRQNNLTLMTPRRDQEVIFEDHRLVSSPSTQPRTLTLPEELRTRQSQLHIRQMNSQTNSRASSQRMESFLRGRADFVVQPARREESEMSC